MIPAVRSWTRDEMMQRFAFFKDLKGSKTGLPDSDLPECDRELMAMINAMNDRGRESAGIARPPRSSRDDGPAPSRRRGS